MRFNLPLKLAIGIVLVFGLLFTGFLLYEPAIWKWYEWKLCSNDIPTREDAAASIASWRKGAHPFVRKWLKSNDERLVAGACNILLKLDGDLWKELLADLKDIIRKNPNIAGTAATNVILEKSLITVEWDEKPLAEILELLRLQTGLVFRLSAQTEKDIKNNASLSLYLKDIKLKNCILILCDQADLKYSVSDGAVHITPKWENSRGVK